MRTDEQLLADTRSSFLWTRILNVPFFAILKLLPVILYKELQITPLQIAVYVALQPISGILASYWSSVVHKRQDLLAANIVWANLLRFMPFLFFPWIDSPWLMILASAIYMTLNRGMMPAWMELFKRNIKGITREKIFAFGSSVDYLGPALLLLLIGWFLDDFHIHWRWLFFVMALLGLSSTFFLSRLPDLPQTNPEQPRPQDWVLKPWKESFDLLKERPDFLNFQIGFMLGGAGLIVIAAILPMFFVDVLHLSYTEMAFAIAVCKGIAFASASPLWVRYFHRTDIFSFCSVVTFLAALFPFLLWGAQFQIALLYGAYLLYGMMQAGSELGWHMSGPAFAKEEESSHYSQLNVLSVGLRGCIAPFCGSLLYVLFSSTAVLFLGSLLCLAASERMLAYSRRLPQPEKS